MNTIKVSVNLAVYNTSQYLEQCLDSLTNQTMRDIEIVIVNDGSTDDSAEICKRYAQLDHRIKIFHKKNGGLASARKAGLSLCSGDYVLCCDSDDWVELDMCEKMYTRAIATGVDVVVCDYFRHYTSGKVTPFIHSFASTDREEILRGLLSQKYGGSIWCKLIRRTVFSDYDINWVDNINLGEDYLIFLKLLQVPISISYLRDHLYHYRRISGGNSYTNMIRLASFRQLEFVHQWQLEQLNQSYYQGELYIQDYGLVFTALRVKDMSRDEYVRIRTKYTSLSKMLKHNRWNLKCVLILISIASYAFARFLCNKIYPIFYR